MSVTGRTTVVTSIVNTQRLLNTTNGNPRWKLFTRFGVFETEPDAQCSHKAFDVWQYPPRPMVELTLNSAGRVVGAERIGE